MASKNTLSDNAAATIEAALKSLKDEPRFELPEDKKFINRASGQLSKSTIYESFIDHVVNNTLNAEQLQVVNDEFLALETKPVQVFGAKETIAMHTLGLSPTVAIELFRPSKGSFDWSKTDWISPEAEYEAFYQHIERVLSRNYQYRLGYGAAKSAN